MPTNSLLGELGQTDPRVDFWMRQAFWPEDGPGQIFIARAIERLGKLLHGPEWLDTTPTTQLVWELPEELSLNTPADEIWRALPIVRNKCESYRQRQGATLMLGYHPPDFPTRQEWRVAVEEMKARSNAAWFQYYPFLQTARHLAQACKSSNIVSLTRPRAGGAFTEQPWWFWNAERAWVRCETCRVDPADPYAVRAFNGPGDWLYIDTAGFDKYCSKLSAHPAVTTQVEIAAAQTDITAIRQAKPKGRRRGAQLDMLAGYYFSKVRDGEWTDDLSDREIARQLASVAAETWETPLDEGYIRERLPHWRKNQIGSERD